MALCLPIHHRKQQLIQLILEEQRILERHKELQLQFVNQVNILQLLDQAPRDNQAITREGPQVAHLGLLLIKDADLQAPIKGEGLLQDQIIHAVQALLAEETQVEVIVPTEAAVLRVEEVLITLEGHRAHTVGHLQAEVVVRDLVRQAQEALVHQAREVVVLLQDQVADADNSVS